MTYNPSPHLKLSKIFQLVYSELIKVSESPEIETEILLCSILKIDKENLIKNNNKEASFLSQLEIKAALHRRLCHTPLEYITRSKNFYGLNFYVDEDVLIPRPETEILVENFIKNIKSNSIYDFNILEVGVGSGCIFISIAHEILKSNIKGQYNFYLVDISEKALKISEKNLSTLLGQVSENLKFHFYQANTVPLDLKNIKMDFIISNPPYIPSDEIKELSTEVKKEPLIALKGGYNGMDIYEKILKKTLTMVYENTQFYFEIHYKSADKLKLLLKKILPGFKSIQVIKDLNNLDRVFIVKTA